MKFKITKIVFASLLICAFVFFLILPPIVDEKLNAIEDVNYEGVSEEANILHQSLFIADMHADTTLWSRDFRKRHDHGHIDLPRMREGNMALQVFTTVTKSPSGQNYRENAADARDNITLLAIAQMWPTASWGNLTERAIAQAKRLHTLQEQVPNQFLLVRSKGDIDYLLSRRSAGELIVGGLLGTEGSHALEGDITQVKRLYDEGFRMMSLHHFFDNRLGGSLHGQSKAGLSDFGRDVVRLIDSMSIVLDVSHSSEKVVNDVLDMVAHPVVVSHTGIKSHCDTPRNISDQLMLRIASKGGLIGIGFWDAICDYSPKGIADAIIYAVKLLGEDHVSLGSDFDGSVKTTIDVSELEHITEELLRRGVSENIIRKVMGENLLRFFRAQLPD